MPLYEYICRTCEQSFEKLVPIARADAPQRCPHCTSEESQRQLSAFAVAGGASAPAVASGPPAGSPFT